MSLHAMARGKKGFRLGGDSEDSKQAKGVTKAVAPFASQSAHRGLTPYRRRACFRSIHWPYYQILPSMFGDSFICGAPFHTRSTSLSFHGIPLHRIDRFSAFRTFRLSKNPGRAREGFFDSLSSHSSTHCCSCFPSDEYRPFCRGVLLPGRRAKPVHGAAAAVSVPEVLRTKTRLGSPGDGTFDAPGKCPQCCRQPHAARLGLRWPREPFLGHGRWRPNRSAFSGALLSARQASGSARTS